MAEKESKELKASKKKTAQEKSKEQTKAAVLKEKEKQQAKQKEQTKAILEKEKEKQKQLLEKEREKQKEQQKLAITNAIAKEREKQKENQEKAIEKAIAKERAKIREALVNGKDPFAKDSPLSKAQLKKATALAEKDEEDFDEKGLASLAQKLNEKKSIDDLMKEKEPKENSEGKELNHVELLKRKREAQMLLNQSKDEQSEAKNELRAKLQAHQLETQEELDEDDLSNKVDALEMEKSNLEVKVQNLLEELDRKNEIIKNSEGQTKVEEKVIEKEVIKDNPELVKKVDTLEQEKANLEVKVQNLLEEIDRKNEEAKSKKPAKEKVVEKEVVKDNPELVKKVDALEQAKTNLEEKVKNLLEELDNKNEVIKSKDGEINVLGLELAKYKEGTQNQVEVTPEVEEIKITGDLLLKIQSLQERIEEKNKQIKVFEDELNNLSEKDIMDKEYLVKIRRIREERNDVILQANITLKSLAELVMTNEAKLKSSQEVHNNKTKELEAFDNDYNSKKGELSYNEREELMRKRSKLCAEIDASQFNVELNSDTYNNYYGRYNKELDRIEKVVSSLNEQEKQLISEYIEKLKEARTNDNEEYQIQVEERERLAKELMEAMKEAGEKAKQEELEIKTKEIINPEDDAVLVNLKSSLAQIGGKLVMLDNKRSERNNVEKVLRTTDPDVVAYKKLYSEKETLNYVIAEDQKRLNRANVELRDNPLKPKKGLFGRKFDPKDLEEDKRRKDDVQRLEGILEQNQAKLKALEEEIKKYDYNEKVLFYKKLLASISELNAREVELKKREAEIKESILNRENELKEDK